MIDAEQRTDPICYHGEGAVWAQAWGGLRCVDMLHGEVLIFDDDFSVRRRHVGDVVAMIRPVFPGTSVVARGRDIALWDERNDSISVLAIPPTPSDGRLNEGGCAPDGSLLIGSMTPCPPSGRNSLFHYSGHGRCVAAAGVSVGNGVGFSPDGRFAYFVDSPAHGVDILTVTDSGHFAERRRFVDIDPGLGSPDGLWVDEQGGVWVAMYGGGRVQRYAVDGRPDLVVSVPARQVTSCTFGGPDLTTLYITTSRENIRQGEDPLAGSIFAAEVGIRGLPVLCARNPRSWTDSLATAPNNCLPMVQDKSESEHCYEV